MSRAAQKEAADFFRWVGESKMTVEEARTEIRVSKLHRRAWRVLMAAPTTAHTADRRYAAEAWQFRRDVSRSFERLVRESA